MTGSSEAAQRCIAHLIESDGPGGAERVVADLASGFQAAGARNVVFVPADGNGETRTFRTPPLQPGQEYSYDLTAEVVRNGKVQTTTERVVVRAGTETRVIWLIARSPSSSLISEPWPRSPGPPPMKTSW